MFFNRMVVTLFVRTSPASSMANPAAIHRTRKPWTRNDSVLNTYAVCSDISALAS